MRLSRNPYFVLGVFVLAFFLLIEAGRTGDFIVRSLEWLAVLGMSVVVVVKMIRSRRTTPLGQDAALPRRWRQWVLDEPDEKRTRTR